MPISKATYTKLVPPECMCCGERPAEWRLTGHFGQHMGEASIFACGPCKDRRSNAADGLARTA